MILLDNPNRRLRVLLGGAGALPFISSWATITSTTQRTSASLAPPADFAAPVESFLALMEF